MDYKYRKKTYGNRSKANKYCIHANCKNISIQHEFYCEEHYYNINETAKILIKMMHSNEVIL
jgi:hypothetical protein